VTRRNRSHFFFVQRQLREAWHVESDEDPTVMLCGYRIPLEGATVKVQYRWGPRKCPDCWIEYQELVSLEAG
jgi:hypothetical protein